MFLKWELHVALAIFVHVQTSAAVSSALYDKIAIDPSSWKDINTSYTGQGLLTTTCLVYSHNLHVLVHRSTIMQCAVFCTSEPYCVATYYKDSVCHQSDGVGLTRACTNSTAAIDALIVDSSYGGVGNPATTCKFCILYRFLQPCM